MLRCVIIDDEPLPIELLSAYAARIPELTVLARFNDPVMAVEFIRNHVVDLIFLDIQMPHLNGIDLLKSLPIKPMAIFTTAFPEFAVDGFELNAVDYLLKPFDFERFRKAVEKATEFNAYNQQPKGMPKEAFIFVKSEYKAVKINLSDILYIEGMDSYVKIYAGGKPVLSLMSMKAMMEMLPAEDFLRVHRSFIIPISKVNSIRNKVIKVGDKEIPIGGTYEDAVETILKKGN
ncbi:MAG TPA: LytTR family DNA-binding domain-containing protein [Catalimonadaceae bacterium]|nr:LytTR family DNA-binding domain-containing protein [Catalimonadaceae bacterium]